ncbi:MAG: hypothetical protein AAGB48_08500 [Planctomycetota bacterium]
MRVVWICTGCVLLATPPLWAWTEYRSEQTEHARAEAALTLARSQVIQLIESTTRQQATLSAIAESELLRVVTASASQAGIEPQSVAEFGSTIETIRTPSDASRSLQRLTLRLQQITPVQLGGFLGAFETELRSMRCSMLEFNRSGRTDHRNAFDVRLIFEHAVLQNDHEGNNR